MASNQFIFTLALILLMLFLHLVKSNQKRRSLSNSCHLSQLHLMAIILTSMPAVTHLLNTVVTPFQGTPFKGITDLSVYVILFVLFQPLIIICFEMQFSKKDPDAFDVRKIKLSTYIHQVCHIHATFLPYTCHQPQLHLPVRLLCPP